MVVLEAVAAEALKPHQEVLVVVQQEIAVEAQTQMLQQEPVVLILAVEAVGAHTLVVMVVLVAQES